MLVSLEFYKDTYYGDLVPEDEFNKYEARAEQVISAATCCKVTEDSFAQLHASIQTAVLNAICAQMDFYVMQGIESSSVGVSGNSFTVGKVSVTGESRTSEKLTAKMPLAPAARMYLEQTGLLNRGVCAPVESFAPILGVV